MRIALYNLEPHIVNSAMMQVSTYHKQKGDTVEPYSILLHSLRQYDKVYAFSIFDFTPKDDVTKDNVIEFIKVKAQDYLNALVKKKPNYPYPTVKAVLRNAFENLQRVQDTLENKGRYDRKLFLCCNRLKKQPSYWYLRENKTRFLPEKTVLIMSIASHRKESKQRRIRLAEIRKQESFLRFHKSNGLWYAYPFRDLFKEQLITDYLINNNFGDVISSGCTICPILLLFRMFDKDPKRYVKSKKYFLKNFENVRFCSKLDHTLDEFIQEVA